MTLRVTLIQGGGIGYDQVPAVKRVLQAAGVAITWDEYHRRYLEEMQAQTELIDELAQLVAEGKKVTLLCSSACTDAEHCHRTLLKQLIEERVQARAQQPATAQAPEASA